jgi:hypothetical protein
LRSLLINRPIALAGWVETEPPLDDRTRLAIEPWMSAGTRYEAVASAAIASDRVAHARSALIPGATATIRVVAVIEPVTRAAVRRCADRLSRLRFGCHTV